RRASGAGTRGGRGSEGGSPQCPQSPALPQSRVVPRELRIVAAGAGIAYAVAVIVLPRAGAPPTTYAAASVTAHVADLAAGISLLAAGLFVAAERRGRLGALAVLAGVAWFGPDWEGWSNGPALVRSLGALTPPV